MAIQWSGPGLILAYAVGGIAIFFIMRALGELLLYRPVAGSFASYAEEFVGPWAGFFTGWSYWFMWIVTGMAELTETRVSPPVLVLGTPSEFLAHGKADRMLADLGLDGPGVAAATTKALAGDLE